MCRALGDTAGPLALRAPVTCFSFVEGDGERPTESTMYFPIKGYVKDDRQADARIRGYLADLGVPTAAYEAAISSFAARPLEGGVGMFGYVSLRHEGAPRLSIYLAPEAYATEPPRAQLTPPAPRPAPTPIEVVERHEHDSLANHPYFRRLRREPVDLGKLWLLMANFRVALIEGFPRMLSSLTARVDDDRLRCVLAKQLNDELGDGDFERAHKGLFMRLLDGLEPWKPARVDEAHLAPGHALRRALEHLYMEADPYEGVGASLLVEVYGKQVDMFLGDEFRRQSAVDPASLAWLHLHEVLEQDHAGESQSLARLIPDGAPCAAAVRGAYAIAEATRAYFDAMYALSFQGG
jgi:pyrroloquinoline quinone (PQQ) biosynthesis protein C